MRMSEEINEIAEALAKAQGEVENAAKDRENSHFRSRYADLAAVREAIRAPLSQNGLSYVQFLRGDQGALEIETMLMHKSGQYLADTLRIPLSKNDAQGIGSAASYGRRYSLMALVGIASSDDDDDGNAASERPAPRGNGKPAEQPRTQVTSGKREAPPEPTDAERKTATVMIDTIRMAESEADLADWLADNKAVLEALPEALRDQVRQAYRRTLAALRLAQAEAAE